MLGNTENAAVVDKSGMVLLVKLLRSTSGTLDKIQLLKEFGDYPHVKSALRFCYEPFIHTYLANIPKPKTVGTLTFDESFHEFSIMFNDLDQRKVTGNAARNRVQIFLNGVTTEAQDVFINILKKDLKANIGEKTLLNAYGDGFINLFLVQLGHPYDSEKKYYYDDSIPKKQREVNTFWYASRKLNGIRAYLEGADVLRTRKGNKIFGFSHIEDELRDLQQRYSLHIVDGELFDIGIPFQRITSYVNADVNIKPEDKLKIKLYVFAVCKKEDWKYTKQMITVMREIDWSRYQYIVPVEYETVKNNPTYIYTLMNKYFEEGFEGAMLRSPRVAYQKDRTNYILKAKPTDECDLRVIDFEAGKPGTKNEFILGALVCEGVIKNKKIRVNVGSGFKEKPELGITRTQVWDNKDEWIDTIVEVEYQSITDFPDPKTGFYSLNFPRFKRQRVDKRL